MPSPDDVLWRYLELRERLGSAQAQNLVAETGLIFDDSCPTCGAPANARIIVTKGDQERRTTAYRCGSCHGSWPSEIGFLLRNEVRGLRRRGGIEGPMSELGTCAIALSKLSRVEKRIYLQLYVFEQVGSYGAVAAEANSRWPRMRPPKAPRGTGSRWTEWRVRTVCDSARRRLSSVAARAS